MSVLLNRPGELYAEIKQIINSDNPAKKKIREIHKLVVGIWEADEYDAYSELECEIIHMVIYDSDLLSSEELVNRIQKILL